MIQAHIFFSGKVQGIGFRYTAKSFAKECNATGWVKNLSDRRVEMVVEASEKNIDKLCSLLEEQFEGFITNTKMTVGKGKGKFKNFQVVY